MLVSTAMCQAPTKHFNSFSSCNSLTRLITSNILIWEMRKLRQRGISKATQLISGGTGTQIQAVWGQSPSRAITVDWCFTENQRLASKTKASVLQKRGDSYVLKSWLTYTYESLEMMTSYQVRKPQECCIGRMGWRRLHQNKGSPIVRLIC